MLLVKEVLDKEMVDRHGHKAGKVDDILIEIRQDGPPVVTALLTGPGSLHPVFGSWIESSVRWLRRLVLGVVQDPQPLVIPWAHVEKIDVVVQLSIDRDESRTMGTETAVWERWIRRIPFAER